MSIFAISDPHLSFQVQKPMGIFLGWDNHENRIKKNWENVVEKSDTVVIPGDISWAMKLSEAKEDLAFLNSLPGEKVILKGNHDYWWQTQKKLTDFFCENDFKTLHIVYNNCFVVKDFAICGTRGWFFEESSENSDADLKVIRREAGRLRASLECAKKQEKEPIVFLHYPPISSNFVCSEIMEVLAEYNVKRCFFGHLHAASTKLAFRGETNGTKFDLVSADFLNFIPKLIEKF